MNGDGTTKCGCVHHKVIPLLVILFGLDFLAYNLGWVSGDFLNVSWPIIVLAGGLMKISKGMCKCC
ncbi:MAG: DUF5668 domain-containing protein [Patescibacteria group bacterium]